MILMSPTGVALVMVGLGALQVPQALDRHDEVAAILGHVREVVGYRRPAAGEEIQATGRCLVDGVDVACSVAFTGSGQFLLETGGLSGSRLGLDGEQAWEADLKGARRVLVLDERRAARFLGWALSQFYLDETCPLRYATRPEDDDTIVLDFETDDAAAHGRLHIDAKTGEPRELEWHGLVASGSLRFDDYRLIDGDRRLPHKVIRDGQTSLRFDSYEVVSSPTPSRFSLPVGLPEDTAIDDSIDPELEVRRVPSGHLLVHPLLDDEDIGWFALDTAAGGDCIDSDVAFKFGLDPTGKSLAGGVGGIVETAYWRVDSLELGPVFIDGVTFVGLDLEAIGRSFGTELAGILGYGFLSRCVIEIDVSTPRVAVYDPGSYELEGATWQKLVLQGRHPCVEAHFEGHEGLFRIDTGAGSSTAMIHAWAVEKYKLLEGRETRMVMAGGVGGLVKVRSGSAEDFVLGGHRFEKPVVEFATESSGALADPYTMGTVGGKLLEPFVLVLDYPNQRIGFKPKGEQGIDR